MRHPGIATIVVLLFSALAPGDEPATNLDVSKPAFEQLTVTIEPFALGQLEQTEELRIDSKGRCWYTVKGREATPNVSARPAAVFHYDLPAEHVGRLNALLEKTRWLAAEGAEGRATHTHPATVTLRLKKDGKVRTVVCHGQRPEPYASLLHELHGLATQERRVYLWTYVGGESGTHAWEEVGREIAGLRGDPYGKPAHDVDYARYLPIARGIVQSFYTRKDGELIPAVSLIGYLKETSELNSLHRMAYDRSSNLRREAAWAMGRIHNRESLPILTSMMSAPANNEAAGLQLINWGEGAAPYIVKLINRSTNEQLDRRENIAGEDMIRAYLDHWDELDKAIDPHVKEAVRKALESANPMNGLIRTTYHKEFLQKLKNDSEN